MAAAQRAPKQWKLTKNETITSYESWRQNLLYILSLDNHFAPFLEATWLKKTSTNPLRGLTDDEAPIPTAQRLSAVQKNTHLDLLLGQIANFCPVVSRSSIVKSATSLNDIWQKIRQHYGFQSTGAHFLDLTSIKLQPDERPEDLYQRLMAFFEDNLLTVGGGVTHHGETVSVDEDLTPTLENTIVVLWLQLIHPGLPLLVKQKYGSELRNQSLASLKPEISQALSSLLDELRLIEDTRSMRIGSFNPRSRNSNNPQSHSRRKPFLSCILCKTAGRNHTTHDLVDCRFLPERDRKSWGRSRLVSEFHEDCDTEDYDPLTPDDDVIAQSVRLNEPSALRVNIIQSPVLNTFYNEHPVQLTLDTGATSNMVRASSAKAYGLPVTPASQMARQADGVTPMDVIGEVHCSLTRGQFTFELDALVVRQLDVDVLAGNPFMVRNDIGVRPAKHQIEIGGSELVHYGKPSRHTHHPTVRRTQSFLLRNPRQTVVLPGEYIQLNTPQECDPDALWALEPRLDSPHNSPLQPKEAWPQPQGILSVDHTVRIINTTDSPILLKSGEHLCQVRHFDPVDTNTPNTDPATTRVVSTPKLITKPFSGSVSLDPDSCLPQDILDNFRDLHLEYDDVFNPSISKYNGHSGKIEAFVNIGPTLPPQRKGRLPQYNRSSLEELQAKFDELEEAGVFAKPEQVNVQVEYLNTSFLVKKPNGGSRLVTSFGEVAKYCKPQPSLMPNVDSVLRDIGRWKFIIITDLSQSFYQIPLSASSMRYCGIATPFKGVRVYTRSAMGMPGSETVLEEIMSRVLGDLVQEGCVAKIADDLYVGGDTPQEALVNWRRVLTLLKKNNLRLSATKTIICPKRATILGWIWSNGTLQASPHKLAALSSVDPPATVQGLRSFVGAYKVLSRVLPKYAELLDPLDQATAGKESRDKIMWTDQLVSAFKTAQQALSNHKTITIPQPSDSLWIVTDGSVKNRGIAATLYTMRNEKLLLAGFFNAKLRKHQVTWLPCEIEALGIGAAIQHFAPFIIQSPHRTQVLTDSKPCVQACEKLMRGEFSNSSRVTTFLSIVSRYLVQVRHIAGVNNLPSDFASRHPRECQDASCQICRFIAELEDSVVRSLSFFDVIDGSSKMPFTSRAAWLATQQECPHLRRTHSHLSQGTRPSKKATKILDVKRYLKDVHIATDGLLVVRDNQPFQPPRDRIVVPRSVLDGLLTAIHIRFCHPSKYQTKRLFTRYFFALDIDKSIEAVSSSCHTCQSLKSIPQQLQPQSTTVAPTIIGVSFAADVIRRYRQYILVMRETVSSYTMTSIINSERHEDLRNAILIICAELRSLCDGGVTIRVDPAPGFAALRHDTILQSYGISLEVGRSKNNNKNPVAERAIEELGIELLTVSPEGGPISQVSLALATANMNSRIRRDGLSAREVWTQRDQLTGEQLPIVDRQVILSQNFSRKQNHMFSAKSKARGKTSSPSDTVSVGDLVYLKCDKSKLKAREKYLVIAVNEDLSCHLRKFTCSQFRSKVYTVPTAECFPVTSTVLVQSSQGPIRGLNEPLDSEDEPEELVPCPNSGFVPGPTTFPPQSANSTPPPAHHREDDCEPQPASGPAPVVEQTSSQPPVPDAIVIPHDPPTQQPNPAVPDAIVIPHDSSNQPPNPRRSSRQRKVPYWLDQDWVCD